MFYAQLGQDRWVLSTRPQGSFFCDVGAGDGVLYSNTKSLEDHGWTGICVEPSSAYERLVRNRRCRVDNRCVWRESGQSIRFRETPDTNLSGIVSCFGDHHVRQAVVETEIQTVTLQDLLKAHAAPDIVDYLSLDTEGSELAILEAFDWSYRIQLLTVEHNWVKEKQEGLYDLLSRQGYTRVRCEDFDDWYVLKG